MKYNISISLLSIILFPIAHFPAVGIISYYLTIIIIVKLSFIARLNKKNFAQKHITEKYPVITKFKQMDLKVSFKQR